MLSFEIVKELEITWAKSKIEPTAVIWLKMKKSLKHFCLELRSRQLRTAVCIEATQDSCSRYPHHLNVLYSSQVHGEDKSIHTWQVKCPVLCVYINRLRLIANITEILQPVQSTMLRILRSGVINRGLRVQKKFVCLYHEQTATKTVGK